MSSAIDARRGSQALRRIRGWPEEAKAQRLNRVVAKGSALLVCCLITIRRLRKDLTHETPNAVHRTDRRARELLEAMIAAGLRFQWSTQVRADAARDPELVRLMKRAGCHTVFIGFESVNPTSLEEMKKGQNLEDMRNAIHVLHGAGIHIHGMFVFGFEGDNWGAVESTVQFIRQMKLTSVRRAQKARHRPLGLRRPLVLRLENQPGLAETEPGVSARAGQRLAVCWS